MTILSNLLDSIRQTPDCEITQPDGLPEIHSNHVLSEDVIEFYTLCGSISLFRSSAYSIEIYPPQRLILANPVIFIGVNENELRASKNDISWSWYIVAQGENNQFITIDFAPERLGRCYDSFWDTHAMPGSSQIIARSFTELLVKLFAGAGNHWYWLQQDFYSIGDAYD